MVSFLTDTVVCGFSLYHILAYFLIYSCIGWCLEVIYAAATTGQLVNRGFLNGPVCPIYGFGMILVLFFLTPLEDDLLLLYIGGVILPSALELVGGWALYKLYHTRWWDYSDFPFNIGGYICLEFCLLWRRRLLWSVQGACEIRRRRHPADRAGSHQQGRSPSRRASGLSGHRSFRYGHRAAGRDLRREEVGLYRHLQ
jgi:hypothetical protein